MATVLLRCVFCDTLNRVDVGRMSDGPRCADCKKPILLDRPQKTTDADFDRMIAESGLPVLVDFWADWCGPCKMIAPALEEISEELADKVTIAKMDIMENTGVPGRIGVQSIPLMVLFKDGKPVAQKLGAAPKGQLKGWLEGEL